jgi:LEA14-like dessication related protein
MITKKSLWVIVTIFLLLLSCAQMDQFLQRPAVKVESVSVRDLGFSDITLAFNLLIHNPNSFGVSLNRFDYMFKVEGKTFLSGVEDNGIQVAAGENSTVEIPITVIYRDLYDLYNDFKNRDSLSYDFSGSIQPGGLLQTFEIPFRSSGSLPNVRIPKISLGSLSVVSIGMSGIQLALAMNVSNPNMFGFEIGKFSYEIDLAGNKFASGFTENLAFLPAKKSETIRLPVSLNFTDVATSIRSLLISDRQTVVGLAGSADLKTPLGFLQLPFAVEESVSIKR